MGLRSLITLVLAAFLATSSTADAQAFKPRGGAKTEKKAPQKGRKKAPKAARKTKSKKRVKRTPSREAEVEKTEPDEDDDDYVLIEDDDE